MRLKFKMLTLRQVVSQIRSEDWFVTIDLKDAYFHISILPTHSLTHRKFLRFGFGCKAFGLALSPRTFRKCVDAVLAPLRLQGIRILNYIDAVCFFPQSLCSREFWREWAGTRSVYFGSTVLAGPSMVLGPDFSPRRLSMGDSHQEGALLTGGGLSPPPVRSYGCGPWGCITQIPVSQPRLLRHPPIHSFLNKETVRLEVETFHFQLPDWYSSGFSVGPSLCRVDPLVSSLRM